MRDFVLLRFFFLITLSSEGSHFCFVLFFFHLILSLISSFCIITTTKRSLRPSFLLFLSSWAATPSPPPPRLPKPSRGGEGRGFPPAGSWVIKTTYRASISLAKPERFAAAVLLWSCCFFGGSLGSNLFDSAHFHQTLESCEVVNHCSQMLDRKK